MPPSIIAASSIFFLRPVGTFFSLSADLYRSKHFITSQPTVSRHSALHLDYYGTHLSILLLPSTISTQHPADFLGIIASLSLS